MGPGIDPHLYKASAGDVRTLSSAQLIFYNGLHLEAAMGEVLEEMDGRVRAQAVTDGISPERLLSPPEFSGQFDPHIWFDVSLWMHAVETVAGTLAEVDPEGEFLYRENAAALTGELETLDSWVTERVREIPEELRVLITAHDAFNYFGEAYGFRVEGLLGLSTAAKAGIGDVNRLVSLVLETGSRRSLWSPRSPCGRSRRCRRLSVTAGGMSRSAGRCSPMRWVIVERRRAPIPAWCATMWTRSSGRFLSRPC